MTRHDTQVLAAAFALVEFLKPVGRCTASQAAKIRQRRLDGHEGDEEGQFLQDYVGRLERAVGGQS